MKQALPIQQPAQAQLSPARPARVPGAAARQPATHHGFAASLQAQPNQQLTSAQPAVPQPACWRVYWGYFSGVLKQMEVCIPTMYLSWAEQPSKKCMSWQAASHVKWRCPNTQSWSWLFSDTNYCSPFYGGQAPLKMLIPRKRSFFFQGH